MAKYERRLRCSLGVALQFCEEAIMDGSISASLEDGSDYSTGNVRVAVRVYERYSAWGSNRVSLSLTLVDDGNYVFLSAITAGGSQAMFFKVNTLGEESFLDTLSNAVERRFDG